MNLIGWITGNPLISGIALAVALIAAVLVERGCYGDERYEEGRKDERNYILSIPQDTTTKPSPPVALSDGKGTTVGATRTRTNEETKAMKKSLERFAIQNDSLSAMNAYLNALLDEKLMPYSATIAGTSTGLGTSIADTIKLEYLATIDTDPNTRLMNLLINFFPLSFPEKTITRTVPVPAETEWYDPYHWMAIGIAVYIAIVSLLNTL